MSLRLYLNPDRLPAPETSASGQVEYTVQGLRLECDPDQRPYYQVANERAPQALLIPHALRDLVIAVSWSLILPQSINCGVYAYGAASARVQPDTQQPLLLLAEVEGPDIDSVCALISRLREGTAKLIESWTDISGFSFEESAPLVAETPVSNMIRPRMSAFASQVRFDCPKCEAKYAVSKNRIIGRQVKVRCRACGEDILIDATLVGPSGGTPQSAN